MGYSLGVDLGTTFVAAALAVSSSRVEMFTLGDRAEVTPAVVYLEEDGTLLTGEAVSGLRTVSHPDRVSRVFKRRLGDPTPVILGGQAYSVTTLLGTLLRDVVQRVVENEGGPPERVVLTHPANWGPFRRALFEEVASFAGVANPIMVTEPEAAAARYAASRQLAADQTVAVYDLGGGTFDATVLRAVPGGVEILGSPEGVERLGGVDFDEAVFGYVNFHSNGQLAELDLRDPRISSAMARLRQDCVLAKETLSVDTETTIPVFLPGKHFEVTLTRADFEELIRAQVDSTIGALSRTLRSAGVAPAELGAVLLVGGSSRIPLVARMVSAELGRPIVVDTHPKYAVALGAATLAARAPAGQVRTEFTGEPGSEPGTAADTPPPTPPPPLREVPVQEPARLAQPLPPPLPPPLPVPQQYRDQTPPNQGAPNQAPPPGEQRRPQAPAHAYAPGRPDATPTPPAWAYPPNTGRLRTPAHSDTVPPGRLAPVRPQSPPPTRPPYAPPPAGPVAGASPWQEPPPTERHHVGAPPAPMRPQRRGLLVGALALAVLALAVTTYLLVLRPTTANADTAQLSLTTSQVRIGDSYFSTASGFLPGEKVMFSWTGPTNGVMSADPADPNGRTTHGPIIERDPPGDYVIIATGQTSGRRATATIEVLPPPGN
ncbi:MAG TPA: Hsp70 family protein [Pseudonocardia sp.]|nr:Hsp70 family protein [Pseudonocardia sp.]